MPWRANVVYSAPTEGVIAGFRDLGLGDALYVVRDLLGIRFEWLREQFFGAKRGEICHGLPARGLLAVMPPAGQSNYDYGQPPSRATIAHREDEYGDDPATKWEKAGFAGRAEIAELGGHAWPVGLHDALATIANTTGETLFHYFCETSGGPPDFEGAVVIAPNVPPRLIGMSAEIMNKPLVEALSALDLVLPTRFFALHASSFDWSRYALT